MIGIKKRDIKKMLKLGAKAGGVSLADVRADIEATIDEAMTSTGVCVEACPVEGKALQFKNGRRKPPVYNYHKCIRCFCCQEMCPHKAIQVK